MSDAFHEIAALKKSQAALRKEAKSSRFKVNVLTNVVIRMEERLEQQAEKILQMQAYSMRKNLIISGLDEPQPPRAETAASLHATIKDFVLNKLKVSNPILLKVFHRFGAPDGSGVRPVVIKVQSIEDKFLLLSKGPNLKDLVNSKGKKFYISEQLPDKLQEERRYNQYWVQENKHDSGSKLSMKISKNKLRINNEPYVKKVHTPNAAEILCLDDDELDVTRKTVLYEGGTRDEKGSEFLAFAASVTSTEDVRKAYRKLKIKYADASHISSAYRLAPADGPFNQEALDDGEHGMGRFLLKLMQEGSSMNTAVFLIRYYGGVHIGSLRFDIARTLATKALCCASAWRQQSPVHSGTLAHRGRGRGRVNRHSRQTTSGLQASLSQQDQSSVNENESDMEPEIVTQFKRVANDGDEVVKKYMLGGYSPGHSSDEAAHAGSEQNSEQEYDTSHEEEMDYNEAMSQNEEMPPLETTQQQRKFQEQMNDVRKASASTV